MPEGEENSKPAPGEDRDKLLQSLLLGALQVGDVEQMLDLTRELLDSWPLQRIRNSKEWFILAALSQVGADNRRLGLTAADISRKVALTARLSYYKVDSDYDFMCRTVALASFEELVLDHVLRCLSMPNPFGHYASSRLGVAAYRQRKPEIVELCIKRSRDCIGVVTDLADPAIELAVLESCYNILMGRDPNLDRITSLWNATDKQYRDRYFHSLSNLLDPEDLQYGY